MQRIRSAEIAPENVTMSEISARIIKQHAIRNQGKNAVVQKDLEPVLAV